MEKNKRIAKVDEAYEESKSAWAELYALMVEDDEFYANKQWLNQDISIARAKQAPTLVLNYIKKQVDVIYGYQSQSKTDIKCFPIDGGDQRVAEVYSRLIKWMMSDRDNDHVFNMAFKDSAKSGIGWIVPTIYYESDPLNGDMCLEWESKYNILPDPYFKKKDLSDADYVIRHKKVNKHKLASLYPANKEEILKISSKFDNDGIRQEIIVPNDNDNQVLVMEYWYKDYEDQIFLIFNGEAKIFVGNKSELDQITAQNPEIKIKKQKIPKIKLIIKADNVILYDGDNPLDTYCFPFVPLFCFYDPSLSSWDLRIQGLIRSLKDSQREKNKRRSVIMQAVSKMPQYGWKMSEGAVDDLNSLKQGNPVIIQQPGSMLEAIVPPTIPQGVVMLEQMFDQDLTRIGLSADMIGQTEEKGSPGVAIQQRIKQSLISHQEVFDNYHFAKKHLGRILVELIVKNFSRGKILRILGEDLIFVPPQLIEQVQQSAQVAQQMAMQLEQEKLALKEQIDQGQEISEEQSQELLQQLAMMEQQVMQAQQQAEQMQAELAMKQAEEEDFWRRWEETKYNARFDTTIDETASNPTYRISAFTDAMQAVQYGIPIPPETIVSLMELPAEVKKSTFNSIAQQQQAQQQMQQMEQQKIASELQLEQQKLQGQMQIELIKQGIDPSTGQRIPEQHEDQGESGNDSFLWGQPKENKEEKKKNINILRDSSGKITGAEVVE